MDPVATVLISSNGRAPGRRQFPGAEPVWDGWRFLFGDPGDEDYDFLVAVHDLRAPIEVRCPPRNVVHIATEPPSFERYRKPFLAQFGLSLGVDPRTRHPLAVKSPPYIRWHLGRRPGPGPEVEPLPFEELEKLFDEPRDKLISVISSDKTFTSHHRRRLAFARALEDRFGDRMDFFGRGIAPIPDKLTALRGYRFHVALENSRLDHYFTEKLTDSIMAGCYTFYDGCPNVERYLPAGSFTRIDIGDLDRSVAIIEDGIERGLDAERHDVMRAAQRRVMYEQQFFPALTRVLAAHARGRFGEPPEPVRYGDQILPYDSDEFLARFPRPRRYGFRAARRVSRLCDRIRFR